MNTKCGHACDLSNGKLRPELLNPEQGLDQAKLHDKGNLIKKIIELASTMKRKKIELTAQYQACQHPSMGEGGTHEVPPLDEELLTIDSCGGRESPFYSVMWSLRGYPCSTR